MQLSAQSWYPLDDLSCDTGRAIHSLIDEAVGDLRKKHGRLRSLLEALRASARQHPANNCEPPRVGRRS